MIPSFTDEAHRAAITGNRASSSTRVTERSYTVRYRSTDPVHQTALIVEDAGGAAYLFCSGELRAQRTGTHASTRLSAILSRYGAWTRLPRVAPYTLSGLRALVGVGGDENEANAFAAVKEAATFSPIGHSDRSHT